MNCLYCGNPTRVLGNGRITKYCSHKCAAKMRKHKLLQLNRPSEDERYARTFETDMTNYNDWTCNALTCFVCHAGPLKKRARIDCMNEKNESVTYCISCYWKAVEA